MSGEEWGDAKRRGDLAHQIYVCIPCKRIMHGARNLGIHCKKHHNMDYLKAEEQGIVVMIGNCENTMWNPCKDPHDREATERELELAKAKKILQERKESQ